MGRLERLAYERAERDAVELPKQGYYFDEDEAERVIAFFELHLKHSKGKWGGQPVVLEQWERFMLAQLFGWKRPGGFRRFRIAYIQIARKNGKTFISAGIGLYLLVADAENVPEVYAIATKTDQARLLFDEACRMVEQSQELSDRCTAMRSAITTGGLGGTFRPLPADVKTLDGFHIHGALVDELHAHKSGDVWDVTETATGAREQSLLFATTTAGVGHAGICHEQRRHAINILEQKSTDEAYFALIFEPDEDDHYTERKTWEKANPNLDVCVDSEQLEQKAERAKESPRLQNSFRRLHCNQWTESVSRWIDGDVWKACAGDLDPKELAESLVAKRCWVGIDLSKTTDLTSMVAAFLVEEGKVALIQKTWIPEDGLRKRVERDKVPYDEWLRDGYIVTTPGNVIDYDYIKKELETWNREYQVAENLYDPYLAMQFALRCQEAGLHMVEHRQGTISMNEPTRAFERMALAKKVIHGGDPVLAWCVGNVAISENASGLLKPDKQKSEDRIDAAVAGVMAVGRAVIQMSGGPQRSRYADGGGVIVF